MSNGISQALLTFPRAEGLAPVVAIRLQHGGDLVQVAEAGLAFVGADEAELVLTL